ncbi:MAG TPA: phosphodiester glycosidase family protein [Actinomycetota bacterium]
MRIRPHRLALVGGMAMIASLLFEVSPVPAPAVAPSDFAFASVRGGDWDVFVSAAGGSGETNLTLGETTDDLDPAWSPNGQKVVFARKHRHGTPDLWVANVDGGDPVQITDGAGADRQPAWSPDGEWIAFVRSFPPKGTSQIFRVSPEGDRLRKLTGTGVGVMNASPDWSPDGQTIAFSSDRDGGFPEIYTMAPDGTGVHRVTQDAQIDANPAWSPDGLQIAFERVAEGDADVWTMAADGSSPANLTASPGEDSDPDWSPDGQWIGFVTAPDGGGDRDIAIIKPDGSGRERVTTDPHADLSPAWRPGTGATAAARTLSARADDLTGAPRLTVDPSGGSRTPSERAQAARSPKDKKKKPPPPKVVKRIAPGVTLTRLYRPEPLRTFSLRIDPRVRSVDVALATGVLPGTERTSRIAGRADALAAVNGDFAVSGGRPAGPFAVDGDLKQTSFANGPVFGSTRGGRNARIDDPTESVVAVESSTGDVWQIDRWNQGAPVMGEVAGFSDAGSSLELPPAHSCAARLVPDGSSRLTADGAERDFTVERRGCFSARLERGSNGVVLAAEPGAPEAALIRSLTDGERITISWTFGWGGVSDGIAGYPLLVRSGSVDIGACGDAICGNHPRTGLGIAGNGDILLVVVDGRQEKWSMGMTLLEFARQMKRLGARWAMNLDGGGSSTMVVRGKVVNRPSGGSERSVSSAVLVLRSSEGAAASRPAHAGRPGVSSAALLDPASTGGLLDALARGTFGPRVDLPPALLRALRAFSAG